jgi:ubiquinone/menaquinone biosynthesis C-methylase UbiE
MADIHEKAASGFQLAGDAYERGRPEYPQESIEHLKKVLELNPGAKVADLGAGTGKFTKLLSPMGLNLIAIEPVAGMIHKFREMHPALAIVQGSAEQIPLPDQSLDAVIAAQAFHWFQGEPALCEIHRVLKRDGTLGMIWNARDESIDWVARLTEIIDPHEGGAPRYKSMLWRDAFTKTNLFGRLEVKHFRYIQSGPPEMIRDRVASISFISALPANAKSEVLNQVTELLAKHPSTKGKSKIDLPYQTDVYWCRKV